MEDCDSVPTLVAAARNGSCVAFEALFRRHYAQVLGLAYHLTNDLIEAEDIVQMVFLKVAQKIRQFQGLSRFETWLYRITVNTVLDERGRSKTARNGMKKYAKDYAANSLNYHDVRPGDSDDQSRIRGALMCLPHKDRMAIVLTACLGMTHTSAAEVMGCSEGTVSWRVHRAKNELREALEGGYQGE